MNIFRLDDNPIICSQYHCDKHVVKMILEYAQILSTAHRVLDNNSSEELYKATHINHPSTIWAMTTSENYKWLYNLFLAVLDEYTFRYNKFHSSSRLLDILSLLPYNIKIAEQTELPLAMPDNCKLGSVVDSYRNYYLIEKYSLAKWTKRDKPYWWNI